MSRPLIALTFTHSGISQGDRRGPLLRRLPSRGGLGQIAHSRLEPQRCVYVSSLRSDHVVEYDSSLFIGQLFLNDLLEYDPRHRITANRACKHPWLSEERAQTPDHGQCMSRQLIPPPKPSTISSATVTVGGGAPPETLFCGQKRKRGNRDVSGAFSVISINEEQRNVAKRPRKERSDEIPGLGQWSDCGGS